MTYVRSEATRARDAARQRARRRAARSGAVRILPVRAFTAGSLHPRHARRRGVAVRMLGMGRPTHVRVMILPVECSVGGRVHVKTGGTRTRRTRHPGSAVDGLDWLTAFHRAAKRHDAARGRTAHPWVHDEDLRRVEFARRRPPRRTRPRTVVAGRAVAGRVAGWAPPRATARPYSPEGARVSGGSSTSSGAAARIAS
jgi:hypothetical protein